jgi:hypothetical protein
LRGQRSQHVEDRVADHAEQSGDGLADGLRSSHEVLEHRSKTILDAGIHVAIVLARFESLLPLNFTQLALITTLDLKLLLSQPCHFNRIIAGKDGQLLPLRGGQQLDLMALIEKPLLLRQ